MISNIGMFHMTSLGISGSVVDKMLIVCCQIRDVVTDQQTGKMRLQFWRDTIDTIYQVITEVCVVLKCCLTVNAEKKSTRAPCCHSTSTCELIM